MVIWNQLRKCKGFVNLNIDKKKRFLINSKNIPVKRSLREVVEKKP